MAAGDRRARRDGARALGVTLTEPQWLALERYVARLLRWNERFNLVSRKDTGRLWPRHVLDSLSVLPVLWELKRSLGVPRLRALDLGTGAGLPGIPLAIADPETRWLLVDRNRRKIRFLEMVIADLDLANVRARAVDVGVGGAGRPEEVDVVVSRAVASPLEVASRCLGWLSPRGAVVLLSGARPGGEETTTGSNDLAAAGFALQEVRRFAIPGLERQHEVTIIRARTGTGTDV